MLHKHTHLPLCVLTACGHWTLRTGHRAVFDLQAQKYPNMVTKLLSPLVQVMACHKFGAIA